MMNDIKVDILKNIPPTTVWTSGLAKLLVKDQLPEINLLVIEDDQGSRVPQMIPDLNPATETFSI